MIFHFINSTSCQKQQKTLPPHIEFAQLTPNNALTEIHYLVQHEEILPTQKIILILFLVTTVRKNILSVIMTMVTPLNTPFLIHFHLNLYSLSTININAPGTKTNKNSFTERNLLLTETHVDSDDDPISERIPNTPNPQHSEFNKPIVSNLLDPHLQQELVYKISVANSHSLAITPVKPNSTNNVIPHFDPSFFEHAQ